MALLSSCRPTLVVAFSLIALTSLACPGCGGTVDPGAAGTIRGAVRYAGPLRGTLRVAAFGAFPPRGRPMAELRVEDPSFPYAYTLAGLPPGRYFVLAIVDTDPFDGPGLRAAVDPGGAFGGYAAPLAVTVPLVGGTTEVDVDLQEPSSSSPWTYR